MRPKFALWILLVPLVLTGCGTGLERAKLVAPEGSDFARNLYDGYIELSTDEFAEGDYRDADSFAERAIAAARDTPPAPEALRARRLTPDVQPELARARARLVALFDKGVREKYPYPAAQAQVGFDCWMQEREEFRQEKDIADCRARFDRAMASMERQIAVLEPAAPDAVPVEPVEVLDAALSPPTDDTRLSFVVYFGFDEALLSQEAIATLVEVTQTARRTGYLRIEVEGHTDLIGPDRYNTELSERRAQAVTSFLEDSGLRRDRLRNAGAGARFPVIDAQRPEPLNRRVEIRLIPSITSQ